MGFLYSTAKIVFGYILPSVVFTLAITVGWLQTHRLPLGTFFTVLVPALKGYIPPYFAGHGKMIGTPSVPDDMSPLSRPEHETFVTLQGTGDKMPQQGIGMCC